VVNVWEKLALAQIAADDFDVAVVGQLPATEFPLGDLVKPSPMEVIALDASFRGRALRKEVLEDPTADADHTVALADLDAELDGVPVGVPGGIFREGEKH